MAEIVGGNGDGAGPADCVISAEGKLGAVASPGGENLGPWCGFSQGYAGHGNLALDNTGYTDGAGNDHILEGIGWLASAGSILPVTAHWQDNPADATADGNGTLVALVQAFGAGLAADCAAGTAGVFNVRGVAAAV
ncbi:MAG: hypothetical protein KY469_15935 [Actinobacteria bacterium]|nr:hypothetical protein [Actinomycetota bacterium]